MIGALCTCIGPALHPEYLKRAFPYLCQENTPQSSYSWLLNYELAVLSVFIHQLIDLNKCFRLSENLLLLARAAVVVFRRDTKAPAQRLDFSTCSFPAFLLLWPLLCQKAFFNVYDH